MQSVQGLTPNYVFVIPSFLKTRGHVGDRITGEKIHGFILKCSFEFDSFVSSSLIVMYSKCEKVEDARKVFDGMTVKDTGAANEALGLVETMKLMGLKPNVKGDQGMVFEIFRLMIADGVEPDVKFRNKEAFDTFKQMLSHGCCPTSATISTLLPACATAARVRRGICLVGCQRRTPYVTWNSIIFGFVNHGYCEEAIELFNQMEKERAAKLDHLTFTAALTACSHVGDIELGQKLFKIMQEKYSIEPPLEH
ncbi:Pentatricopeptide repeat-containing protein [Glycine max]|nr:Pentatricopeptide repeat-containing protein [Glycine max]